MKSDLVIMNGTIVSSQQSVKANIHIKDEKIIGITSISEVGESKEVFDASNLYIMPGIVDPHVHMMDPGYTEREDFITGTRAAASGGVTTVIEHHRTEPPVISEIELNSKIEYLKDRSIVDFALMGGGTPDNVDALEAMWNKGVTSFKMFTCSLHQQPAMLPVNLLATFKKVASLGATVLIHCEDDSLTTLGENLLKEAGRNDYLSHSEWRSLLAEEVAVDTVINVAKATGAHVNIAHVSHPRLLDKIAKARMEGYPIYAESCPHYFHLSTEDLEKKGPWVKFAPAVREKEDAKRMWNKLNDGLVAYLGSDHCPFPKAEKLVGEQNIWEAPNGIPGVETGLKLMLTGVNEGLTTINKVAEVMSENPAKLYGLYPKKGTITIGSDADLVLVDMEKEEILNNENIVSKCAWTPYDGKKVKGAPKHVFLRGQLIVEDYLVVGEPGLGQFIPRQI